MQIRLKETKQKIRVEITGEATVQHIEKIHAELVKALEKEKLIEFTTGEITKTDVSFLQLLLSVYRSQKERGKRVAFTEDQLPPAVLRTVEKTGFFRALGFDRGMDEQDPFRLIMQ